MPDFDHITLFWLTGLVGVAFYLGSYAALQSGLLKGAGYTYTILNLTAASLVFVSLFAEWNMSSAIIQISWITISIVGLTRLWFLHRMLRFNADEQVLVDNCFATMSGIDVRRLLDLGVWIEAPKGYVLTEQGLPVENLYYIQSGGVDVLIDGQKIAQVGEGDFIGEMGCLTHAAATATVTLNQSTRFFRIRSDDLCKLLRRNPDLQPHLEYAFAHKTRKKLVETNAALRDALQRQTQMDMAV